MGKKFLNATQDVYLGEFVGTKVSIENPFEEADMLIVHKSNAYLTFVCDI